MTAPVASGGSEFAGWAFHPLERCRLSTAHTPNRRSNPHQQQPRQRLPAELGLLRQGRRFWPFEHPHLHATFRALSWRGGPIRAGWNRTAAASVQTSAKAISLPMLEMPGWSESQRLPNAVAVVSALKNTARVRVDCSRLVRPARQAMM